MARRCLRLDHALNDDERLNLGCTDEWGYTSFMRRMFS